MSHPRHAAPDAGPAVDARPAVLSLVAGTALFAAMLLLGLLAKSGPLARLDLSADQHIAGDRIGLLTGLARAASTVATPEIAGPVLMIAIPVVLLLMRRRLDAVKVFCMFAGALVLAEIGKKIISEHRPPLALRAMSADAGGSYPSGHVTTAAILAIALVVVAATIWGRAAALILGGLFAVGVAVSRVYLGDHYPADVLGSMLCALAAGLIVTGLFRLPALQPWLRRMKLIAPTADQD